MEHLKKLRKLQGLSQERLAEIVGLSQTSIYQYEKGICQPDIETLSKLADYFDTSVDYLVERTNCMDGTAKVYENSLPDDLILLAKQMEALEAKKRDALQIILNAML